MVRLGFSTYFYFKKEKRKGVREGKGREGGEEGREKGQYTENVYLPKALEDT